MEGRGEDGFSLIELVVALMVMSVAIAGLFSVLNVAFRTTSIDAHRETATALATQQLSRLRAMPYDQVGSSTSTTVAPPNQEFDVITAVDSSPTFKQAAVTVQWSDTTGSHRVSADAYLQPSTPGPHVDPTTSTTAPLVGSSCVPASVTIDPPAVTRDTGDLTAPITVTVQPGSCAAGGLWAGVTASASTYASTTLLTQSDGSMQGQLPAAGPWDLGPHEIDIYTGPAETQAPAQAPVAMVDLCVEAVGATTC